MLRIARIAMLLGTARALLVSPSPRPVLAASWPRQRLTMAVPSDLKFPWQSGTYSDEQVEEVCHSMQLEPMPRMKLMDNPTHTHSFVLLWCGIPAVGHSCVAV